MVVNETSLHHFMGALHVIPVGTKLSHLGSANVTLGMCEIKPVRTG